MKNLIFPLFLVCIFFSLPSRGQGITGSGDPAGPGSMPYYDCENNCIEIMFDESSRVRLREGIPVDLRTDALKGVNEVLGTLAWHQWQRICDVPEETVDSWQENGERNTGKPVYNLNNIYRLHIPETEGIWKFCEEMEALPGVYMARPVPKPVVAPLPGNYQPQQVYEDPVSTGPPTGIDAEYAWTQTGGTGSGITVCDLEYSWNYNHADVTKGPGSALNSWTDPFSNTNHGTAVIGEMVSDNNGWGTTGICYNSGLLTCGTYYGSPAYWNVPGAIALAIAALQPGDIILLEQQWDYTGNAGYVPIEWWNNYSPSAQTNNAVYAAIVNAISNGIHVVEAGGNGNVNTGSMTWYGDSGAIIVGAGGATASNDLTRLSFSSYGPRFNLQGWGEKVVTTGYGDLYSSQGVNYYYTSTFSGTSSASPIVAGAVACLSGYWLANISTIPPTPAFVRSHLATYGTPQVTPPSGNIGPRPDLGNAIPNIPPQTYYDWGDAPDPTYPTLATSNGANHPLDGITFMGALVDPEGNGLPHPQALGDDLNNLADEDGVTFLTPLSPGSTANIQVVASVQGFLSAWIDFNANGTWGDPGEQIFNTAALAAGTNNLSFPVPFTAPPGAQTFARFRFINVPIALPFYSQGPSGEVEDYMVIIEESQKDWGDAPDAPYPTLAASNGANHQIDWVTYLGNQVDPEPDGQPDPQALGDDNDIIYPPPNDDEDGVVFTTPLYPGQPATVQVTASAQGYLNTWIDFNMNGSWADPGEQVFVDFLIGPGTIFLNFAVPSPNPSGQTYARFRFCTMQGLTFTGGAPDGEVEDYEVWIEEGDQFDWGDAPDAPYPTLAGSNGANHKIDWVTFLGGQIDAEPDGQPDPNALGDDNNGAPDEDGVVFNGPFSPGMTTSITVFANVPGVLNAWFDFNMNGSWADPGEHVFVDVTLASGGNNLLVPVPAGIGFGQSFARFRFSNFTGLTFTGTASNGEVEDYEFWIEQGGTDGEFGDAPEGSLGYPGLGVMGQFPTCSNVPVSGWVQHMNYGAWMGPQIDFETEGNAGFCPLFNPNTYDMDECQQDGDAGLLFPDSYTITGAIGSETVIPCPGAIGVTFLTGPCQSVVWGINMDIDLHNHIPTGSQAYLNIVIDWDQNGSWGGSVQCPGIIQPIPEHVLVDFPVPIPWDGPASALVPPVFMAGPNTGYLWMRITISDLPVGTGWDGSGVFDYGESEDFLIAVGTANLDWGDAPDPSYPTLAVSLGASHVVDGITFLGNSVDAEMDGQPDINSLGDDNDGNDDDDGVIWTNYLYPGITTNVKVTASVPGFLSAWFDFNDNGSWADAGEQIFTDVNLPAGSTTLSFTIPASAVPGITYTRFRFSTIQGLSYTGQAPDGEVEDYRVGILQPGGDGIIVPDPNLALVQNEISMALLPGVTPGVPAVLLAAYNDHPFPGGPGLGVSYSNDGGLTWNPQNLPYPFNPFGGVPFVDAFDPTATADGNGDLYAAHISTDYNWGTGPVSGLFVHKSTTGGATWTGPYTVAIDGPPSGSPDPNYRFNDRCQITADINPASPYYNNLYIVWIKDRGWNMPLPYGDIYFSSSTNGGLTWSPAVTINQTTNNMGNMPVPAVAPDGTLYVCWVDYNVLTGGVGTIFLDYSTNGGNTWLSTDILVRTVNLPPINLNGGTDARAKGAAVIQVSPFNPQQIYITYAEMIVGTPDEADIFFIQSPDAGLTWTNPLRVNDDLTTCDQVMPWMDIKPNGTIDIAWYDRRNDAADLFWDVYIATSTNSGTSFSPNVMLNDISYNTPATIVGPWMGEYLGLVVDATHAYIGFTSSVPDINGDILFDRYENPEPEIDFGDAPDPPYPTLFASNGARHIIDGVTFMGGGVDSDPDGQPDPNALGDDNDGNDDEDGVVLPAKLYPGGTAAIQVTVSVTGYFNGWIDYNLNGSWGDPGEQVFTDA
ncbi:MAG: S8 family serine peptidase, partial [Bacteroidales bacterium]|nr:S8 family serine peptidase [Bacteroidales bacterium]